MKAVVLTRFGSPDVLQLKEVEKPRPKDEEVLLKVHATAINDWDWQFMRGKPLVLRLIFGIFKPRVEILGAEVSGRVEAVGKNAKRFQPGDDAYGDISESGFGGFAEYVCAHEDALVRKPPEMTFEEATSLPHASMLAMQGLIDRGQIQEGQKLLINGAGGGVGTLGVQIAKLYGAETTGVLLDFLACMIHERVDAALEFAGQEPLQSPHRGGLIAMGTFHKVAEANNLAPGQGMAVEVAGNKIALFNVDGTCYAIGDTCTHVGGPLSEGSLEGSTVTCPWHGANFDVCTGKNLTPPARAEVTSYNVRVEGDDVEVEIS